jgi:hypothetical protein
MKLPFKHGWKKECRAENDGKRDKGQGYEVVSVGKIREGRKIIESEENDSNLPPS